MHEAYAARVLRMRRRVAEWDAQLRLLREKEAIAGAGSSQGDVEVGETDDADACGGMEGSGTKKRKRKGGKGSREQNRADEIATRLQTLQTELDAVDVLLDAASRTGDSACACCWDWAAIQLHEHE